MTIRRDKHSVAEGIEALQLSRWRTLSHDCNETTPKWDSLLATIMLHTPNINTLTVENRGRVYPSLLWLDVLKQCVTVSGDSLGRVHNFSHLKSVSIYLPPSMALSDLLFLFRLYSLEDLRLWTIHTSHVPSTPLSIQDPSNSIRYLDIQAFVDTDVLVNIIQACQGLETFALKHRDDSRDHGSEWRHRHEYSPGGLPEVPLFYDELTWALSQHRHILTSIAIEEELVETDDPPLEPNFIESLADMPNLQYLEIPAEAFIDFWAYPAAANDSSELSMSTLPPSLTELCLYGVSNAYDESLPSILHHLALRASKYPQLATVCIEANELCRSAIIRSVGERFTKELGDAGIKFELMHRFRPWDNPLDAWISDEDDGQSDEDSDLDDADMDDPNADSDMVNLVSDEDSDRMTEES